MTFRIILAGALLTMGAPGLAILTQPPQSGQPVLVLAPPWLDVDGLVTAAGGGLAGPFAAPFARLAFSPSGDSPDLARRLAQSGAWAVVDGSALALICGA